MYLHTKVYILVPLIRQHPKPSLINNGYDCNQICSVWPRGNADYAANFHTGSVTVSAKHWLEASRPFQLEVSFFCVLCLLPKD